MQKKFALIVQYASGEVVMITKTPDLVEALNEFVSLELKDKSGWDKGLRLPEIKAAKLVPVWYESVYGEQDGKNN